MSEVAAMDKVQCRIQDLEQAIQRLDFVKRHLSRNSSEIKSQIHTSISGQLEALRSREVCLLGQVDAVLGGKESVLQGQQARLHKALGVLHSSLAHAQHTAATDHTAAVAHLTHALNQLSGTELKAEETPFMAFRAQQGELRQAIVGYGRVDANGMPSLSAFSAQDQPSASLPRHLEEYEDSEHHVFYKALQDGSHGIRVTMPKLSTRVEDWLQRPVLELSTGEGEGEGADDTPLPLTSCSIQNWLSQIKHNPDVEEDLDFEIVDHSGSSQRESPMEEESQPLPLEGEGWVDVFRHIPHDLQQWLCKGTTSDPTPKEDELREFFKHIPHDTSVWLATARRQLESLDALKRGAWFGHISTATSSWLRRTHDRRASTAPPPLPDMFAHISHDNKVWLNKASNSQEGERSQKPGGTIFPVFPSPQALARVPDVIDEYRASAPPVSAQCWLMPGSPAVSSAVLTPPSSLPGVQRYMKSAMADLSWLADSSRGVEAVTTPLSGDAANIFSHISNNQRDWLSSGSHHVSPSQAIDLKAVVNDDSGRWLWPRSQVKPDNSLSTLPPSPLDSLRLSRDTSHWLMSGQSHDQDSSSDTSFSVLSSESSSASTAVSSSAGHPLDLSAWIYQKCL